MPAIASPRTNFDCTVHGAVEVGLLCRSPARPLAGLGLVDQPGVQVGVDRHLLAGHGVEGEARAPLRRCAWRALVITTN